MFIINYGWLLFNKYICIPLFCFTVIGNITYTTVHQLWLEFHCDKVVWNFRITVLYSTGFRNMRGHYFITADFFGMPSVRTIQTHSFADSRFLLTYAIRILIAWLCVDNFSCVTQTSRRVLHSNGISSTTKNLKE